MSKAQKGGSGYTRNDDHDYCVRNGAFKGIGVKTSRKEKSIRTPKDLQKQNELVTKRFKKRIEEVNGGFQCRCCSNNFSTYTEALLHSDKQRCKQKGKKVTGKKVQKCNEIGCGLEFLYYKDLKKHAVECHPNTFKCSKCDSTFTLKKNLIAHLKKCRNADQQFECSLCDFVSTRKSSVDRHETEQHHEFRKHILDDISEKEVHPAVISSIDSEQLFMIAVGRKAMFFKFTHSLENIGTLEVPFPISSLVCHGRFLVLSGGIDCEIKEVSFNDQELTFTHVEKIICRSRIKKTLVSSENVLLLVDFSVEIHDLQGTSKKEIVLESDLVDMTVSSCDKQLLFVVDKSGSIWFDHISSFSSKISKLSKKIEHFVDPTICSIFYSETFNSLLIGHTGNKCSKLDLCNIDSIQTIVFGEIQDIQVT